MKLFMHNYSELDTFADDTVKALLVYGYSYDPDGRYVSDLAEFEVTDISYERLALTGKSRNVNLSENKITLTADDMSFSAVTGVATDGVVIYKEVTNDTDSLLLGYWPFVETITNGLGFDLVVPASGLVVIKNA